MKKKFSLILIFFIILSSLSFFCVSCNASLQELNLYVIDAEVDCEKGVIHATEYFTYRHYFDEPVKELSFNLYANAYSKSAEHKQVLKSEETDVYYKGIDYGNIELTGVTENAEQLAYSIDETILTVSLDRELFFGESVTVKFDFKVVIPYANARLGIAENGTINVSGWYPVLCARNGGEFYKSYVSPYGDPYFTDCADYRIKLTYDGEYVAACPGNVKNVYVDNGRNVIESELYSARDFAFLLNDNYKVLTGEYENIKVNYFHYADETPDFTLSTAVESLKFYSELFGRYPYDTYTLAETELNAGGMEFPSIVYISSTVSGDEREEVIAHETAHQWWYGAVGSDNLNEAWQDEGLTEFSTLLYMESKHGNEYYVKRISDAYRSYNMFKDITLKVNPDAKFNMNKNASEYMSDYEYVNVTYVKGLLMFDTIYNLNKDKTLKALKRYYNNCAYKIATADDLIESFESQRFNIGGIIKNWINGDTIMLTF